MMLRKKWMTMGLSVCLAAVLMTAPAYAHGHHSRGHHSTTGRSCRVSVNAGTAESVPGCPAHAGGSVDGSCLVCGIDGCTQTGHHLHEDAVYCGYPHANGYCDGTCIE